MLQQVKEFERHLISEEKSKATVDRFTHTNLSTINDALLYLDVYFQNYLSSTVYLCGFCVY